MIGFIAGIIAAYLTGAIPTAFLIAKAKGGPDIRTVGSGNVGATNVYRSVGKAAGFFVLLIDILKGAVPVMLIPAIFSGQHVVGADVYKVIIGASAIAGHVWTVFLRFKGGKGVATTAGVCIVIAPKVFGAAFLVWVLFFAPFRYVSLASIAASITLPIASIIFGMPVCVTVFFSVLCVIGIYKHKQNIIRLAAGKEHKI